MWFIWAVAWFLVVQYFSHLNTALCSLSSDTHTTPQPPTLSLSVGHAADTGGFFVAVLQKTGELPLEMHPRRGALRAIRKEAEAEAWAAGEAAAAAGKAAEVRVALRYRGD